MAKLNTEHFLLCIKTLEASLAHLQKTQPTSIDYEVFRCATIKGFELVLELSGKLLRKALKAYMGNPQMVDDLVFKEIFRHAAKHNLLSTDAVERWFAYRDNRNNTAHDYGKAFTETTIKLLPQFIDDAKNLQKTLQNKLGATNA